MPEKIQLPGSQLIGVDCLLAAAFAGGGTTLKNVTVGTDFAAAAQALQKLGPEIEIDPQKNTATIKSAKLDQIPPKAELNAGGSFYAACTLTALLACADIKRGTWIVDTDDDTRNRAAGPLFDALNDLGAHVECIDRENFFPVKIVSLGGIAGGLVRFSGRHAVQFLAPLMLAAPFARAGNVAFQPVGEIDIADETARMVATQSLFAVTPRANEREFVIVPNTGYISPGEVHVEPDALTAAFFMNTGVIRQREFILSGIGSHSRQKHIAYAGVLRRLGVPVSLDDGFVTVGPAKPTGGEIDLTQTPCLVLPLAILAVYSAGVTILKNFHHDRQAVRDASMIAAELKRLGVNVEETGETLKILGAKNRLAATATETYRNPWMAMALTFLSVKCENLQISDPECVNEIFPGFFEFFDGVFSARETPKAKKSGAQIPITRNSGSMDRE